MTTEITLNAPVARLLGSPDPHQKEVNIKNGLPYVGEIVSIRDPLVAFTVLMEHKLRKNDHKTGWRHLPIEALRRLMMLEVEEYNVAREFFGLEEARKELVDVANFAMMLHDRLGLEDRKNTDEAEKRGG